MPSSKLRILVTGAGAPGIKGTLHSLHNNPDKSTIETVGVDMNKDAVGQHFVDKFELVPMPTDPSYLKVLLDICQRENVQAILPQTTKEIFVLSEHLSFFQSNGIPVIVAPFSAITMANDKWNLMQYFQHLNLPIPKSFFTQTREEFIQAATTLGYPKSPIAVKPPISNGMRGFRVLTETRWNLERFMGEKPSGEEITLANILEIFDPAEVWPKMIVSEFLPGAEFSVDGFCGEHVSIAIPRLRKVIRSGISFETILQKNEQIEEYTLKAAKNLGLKYAFGFQFKLDKEGIPKVLECNPRVQGTMVASLFGGANLIWAAVREALGQPITAFPVLKKHSTFYRYWGGVGINDEETVVV